MAKKPVAHFLHYPDQLIAGAAVTVDVYAIHEAGITSVAFEVTDGTTTLTPANPSAVDDYYYSITFDATALDDGPVTVTAVVTATDATTRTITRRFDNNSGGTLPTGVRYVAETGGNDSNDGLTSGAPKATIWGAIYALHQATQADGGTVKLLAGTHSMPSPTIPNNGSSNSTRYVTIAASDGLTKDDVTVAMDGTTTCGSIKRLRYCDVSIDTDAGALPRQTQADACMILEDCWAGSISGDREKYLFQLTSQWDQGYWTVDCDLEYVRFVRGYGHIRVTVAHVFEDAFSDCRLVVGRDGTITCTDIQHPTNTGVHADLGQYYGQNFDNVLWVDVVASDNPEACGINFSVIAVHDNYAFVGCDIDVSQWSLGLGGPCNNLFFKLCRFRTYAFANNPATGSSTYTDVIAEDCIFDAGLPTAYGAIEFRSTAAGSTPSVASAAISPNGSQFIVGMNINTTGTSGFTLAASGGPVTLSGGVNAGLAITYNTSRIVYSDETVTWAYDEATGNVISSGAIALAAATSQPVTNGSALEAGVAFPTGWTRKHPITIDATKVGTGGLANFSVLITRVHLDDEVCDPSGPNSAYADGRDIRFTSDSAGETELARDIIKFDHDTATGAADASVQIRVNVPAISDSTNTTIYVWYANDAAVEPAANDAIGQYNAYADHWEIYYPLEEDPAGGSGAIKDRTRNQRHGTATGLDVSRLVAGKVGKGLSFDGTGDRVDTAFTGFALTSYTYMVHWKSTDGVNTMLSSTGERLNTASSGFGNESLRFEAAYGTTTSSAISTDINWAHGNWYHTAAVVDGADKIGHIFFNGTEVSSYATQTAGVGTRANTTAFKVGDTGFNNDGWNGLLDDAQMHSAALSAAWILTERNQTTSPATFAAAGAPEDADITAPTASSPTVVFCGSGLGLGLGF